MRLVRLVLIYIFFGIVSFSCTNHDATILNSALEIQLKNFITVAKHYNLQKSNKNETVLVFFAKMKNNYKVSFHYRKPDNFKNLFTVIENKNLIIFIYSDADISKFVYAPTPFKIDTSFFEVQKPIVGDFDWYSDILYFNGTIFTRDSFDIN